MKKLRFWRGRAVASAQSTMRRCESARTARPSTFRSRARRSHPAIDAKRHRFLIDLPRQAVRFAADPLRLAQVLSNLLTNAARYTDPEGTVELLARREDEELVICVRDTGIGFTPEAATHLFKMFSRVNSGPEHSEDGLGIGLALARGLVELHGGTLAASSAGPGQGSEFTVRLPIRATSESCKPEQSQPAPASRTSLRVLVADDNRDAAESLAILLQIEGHDVHVVHDGRAAMDAFAPLQPEVAILDIGMPGLNGYEIARRVRQGPLGRAITLIAVTGWGQDADKARALDAGFNHHFTKPVDPERLTDLLRGLSLQSRP